MQNGSTQEPLKTLPSGSKGSSNIDDPEPLFQESIPAPFTPLVKVALYPPVADRVAVYADQWGLSRQAAVNQLLIECFTHLHDTGA